MHSVQKITLYVHGMHCQSCVVLTESEITDDPRVSRAKSNLASRTVEVVGNFGDLTPDQIAAELSVPLKPHGYTLATTPEKTSTPWHEFATAIPLALGFMFLFFLLQKMGVVNLVSAGSGSYTTAFIVGVVASVSTCMAVVGGLVLSLSATVAKTEKTLQPHVLFHVGRIVGFFVLGGVIGAIGSAFVLGQTGTFVMGLLVGLIMLIMGVNLLDIFPGVKRLMPAMPKWLSTKAMSTAKLNHSLAPALIGIATFFMPCGFTQSMQIFALSTGSFMTGALTMLFFALGTLPVLALVSMSSYSIRDSARSGVFFKTAGLVVILFALFNILNSFATIGIIRPLFNF